MFDLRKGIATSIRAMLPEAGLNAPGILSPCCNRGPKLVLAMLVLGTASIVSGCGQRESTVAPSAPTGPSASAPVVRPITPPSPPDLSSGTTRPTTPEGDPRIEAARREAEIELQRYKEQVAGDMAARGVDPNKAFPPQGSGGGLTPPVPGSPEDAAARDMRDFHQQVDPGLAAQGVKP